MAVPKDEKNRKLSAAEQRRLEAFEMISADLVEKGYQRTDLTVGIVKANVFAFLMGIPVIIIGFLLFILLNWNRLSGNLFSGWNPVVFIAALLVLVVVHEGIHGISWAICSEHHFTDIEFGFMKEYLTPYCTCRCPLSKGKYIFGALMPLVILGILPMIIAIGSGNFMMLWIGIVMVMSAGGDIMIVLEILKNKSRAEDVLYMDHPTQAGGVLFER